MVRNDRFQKLKKKNNNKKNNNKKEGEYSKGGKKGGNKIRGKKKNLYEVRSPLYLPLFLQMFRFFDHLGVEEQCVTQEG